AANNPFSKQIETWDRSTFMEQHTAVTLGRTNNKLTKIENSLALKGTFEDYSILPLKIKEKVIIKRRDLIFHPYYIISFNLNGLVKTPDKQTHSRHNSGTYYVDGLSGEILYRKDVNGNHKYDLDKEQEQAIKDLHENDPQNMIEVTQVPNSEVKKLDPSMYQKDVEFRVRRQVVNDNKDNIPYKIRRSKDIVETKYHPYVPEINSITVQSKMIYVPKMEIEFESKEYSYSRIIFPASEVWLEDEISDCKHMLGRKRPTFAVCEVCGIAKCEKDLFCDDSGQCYCKNDASEELKEAKKENSFSAKLKRFSFKK
ncbi:MAG: hypothetical protein KGL95_00190, partial [Patescibacteria group bacterium]|nr:hypothetical protein [Patescibacteria group bacterium]